MRTPRLILILFAALAIAAPGHAQGPIPERHLALARDTDYPGNDLRPLFDITLPACEAACRADPDCAGFTYNSRNGSCFPKSALGDPEAYVGALSGRFVTTNPRVLARLDSRLAALAFLSESDFADARQQALNMTESHFADRFSASAWREAAQREADNGNLTGAMRMTGAAITLGDAAADWAAYADLLLRIEGGNSSTRRLRDRQALSAAVNAGLRAEPGDALAEASTVLAQALERQGRGRDAVAAMRLAAAEAPTAARSAALDRLVALYGFRVTDTRVDQETDFPRICVVFSEPLAEGGVTYGDFLQTTTPGLSVEAEGRQLCVTGVTHGMRYEMTLRPGLPAASGEALRTPVQVVQYVRDRDPSVRFAGRAYILPAHAGGSVPIVAVNTDAVRLRLHAVSDRNILRSLQDGYFGQPLRSWQMERFTEEMGETVWEGTAEVARQSNREVSTQLPLGDILTDLGPGLYALEARSVAAGNDAAPATQWLLVSDLGVSTLSGADGLHVFVRSLADTGAKPDVTVSLIAESNRVLGTVQTDSRGYAQFPVDLMRGAGASAPALLTVADAGRDLVFLSLREPEFDLSDRGVAGRAPAGPLDVFLTTDRGAYRAGETVNATILARDGAAAAVPDLPLTAIVTRADGVEYGRYLLTHAGAGGYVARLPLGAGVPRGTWRLDIHADPGAPPLASTTFLVEDFLPERLDLALDLPEDELTPGRRAALGVQADYLFGAPAADLAVDVRLALRPTRRLEAHPGYSFGRHDTAPDAVFTSLPAARTDTDGAATIGFTVPSLGGLPQPASLTATVTVAEGSGRPVERQIGRDVTATGPVVGIRPLFDEPLSQGAEARFRLIAVGAADLPVSWTVNRVERRYQWYRQSGRWSWEPVTTRTRVASGEATLGEDPVALAVPVDWGRHELRVESRDGGAAYTISSVAFEAGWFGGDDGTDTPDRLELSLDAEAYVPGDTARLRLVPRRAGNAILQIMSHRLIDTRIVEVTGAGPVTVDLPVTDAWGTGAYVTATMLTPVQAQGGAPAPVRAIGLAHATVDPGARALDVALDLPDRVRPRGPLEVGLQVDGARPGDTIYATIAAVDLGILNLTGFDAPDPQGHYFGQRRLGMALRDVYGRLIDARDGAEGRIRQGGDAGAGLRMQAPPPTEELVALFSGPLTVQADGTLRTRVDLPAFNGTVRVMAVAWSQTGVGQASGDVLVRDPVAVTASLPRFLGPGDSTRLLLELTHTEGPAGEVQLSATASPGLNLGPLPDAVTLAQGETRRLSVPVSAGGEPGRHEITLTTTLPDGTRLERRLALPVQINDPVVAETTRLTLEPGQSLTLDGALFAGLRPGTGRVTVSAGPLARFDAPGLLQRLDGYPYGCTEQITSQALPLLYLSAVAAALDLGSAADLTARIDTAIGQVLANQAGNGGFGLWRAASGDLWLDAYVTDFLSRARAEGHAVPPRRFGMALDNLSNAVARHPDFEDGGEGLAYALMVLAREGRATMGDLRYYADVKAEDFATPLALGQLGAALAFYGDQARADAMFRAGVARMQADAAADTEVEPWRMDYGSARRDAAGLLAVAAAAGSQSVDPDVFTPILAEPGDHLSTQDAVWMLLAAHALIDGDTPTGLTLAGQPLSGPVLEAIAAEDVTARDLVNTGRRDALVTLTRFGQPEAATEAFGNRYRIERRYLTLDGQPADPTTVPQGTRLVAVLRVLPLGAPEGRLMIADPLPAGFEIDNPNLLASGDLAGLGGLSLTNVAEHLEFRQDRFLAAVDYRGGEDIQLAYIVRAVTPGAYHHPAAHVEDMYRPQYRAQTASGRVTVTD
jgi:uncharacterized protein YfaS (alpha-2-macroglobulin family)